MMFTSPDTLIPDPYNPLDWNRYLYARANPLRFSDPTGHFTEDQLIEWYGKEWRKQFSDGWQALLLEAEFGDAVAFGGVTAVFALGKTGLVGWDVNSRSTISVEQITAGSGELALYRPGNVNIDGGPSQFGEHGLFGEHITPELTLSNNSNYYVRIMGDPEHTRAAFTLPDGWYSGDKNHVAVDGYFAGFNLGLSDIVGGGLTWYTVSKAVQAAGRFSGKVALEGLGGWAGLSALAVDVASWTTWDTSYIVTPGQGPMPICPVPTPPLP